MRKIEYKNWRYCWTTVPAEDLPNLDYPTDKPYACWIEKPIPRDWYQITPYGRTQKNPLKAAPTDSPYHSLKKVTYFKTRASARRSAKRQCETHEMRNRNQAAIRASGYIAPSKRCSRCETHKRMKDDYLCEDCRYGR